MGRRTLPMPFQLEVASVHGRLYVAEQIFVSPDRAARPAGRPFDIERAFGVDASEVLHPPVLRNNVAVPSDARQMASAQGKGREGQQLGRQKRPDRDRAHTNSLFGSEMRSHAPLDSKI